MLQEKKSFCRICNGGCGVRLGVEDGRIVSLQADKDDPMTMGYACIKGLHGHEAMYARDRILHPLKRQPDGGFARIGLEQALDEIAAKLRELIDSDGPDSIGAFRGGGGFLNGAATNVARDFLQAIGSNKFFSTITIDQSAKMISIGRLGIWPAGRDPFAISDVLMLVGSNPLVSIGTAGFDMRNPTKRMKEARARGMKLIVIDPRRTETAAHADIFLQPYPGEDVSIIAGLLRIVLAEGWIDNDFIRKNVDAADLAALKAAVEPFTPDYVARRAGVDAHDLRRAAEMFARDGKRGVASSGTGPNMAPHSNLFEHLLECLNVVCGRFLRAGEQIPNPGVLQARYPRKAQVTPAPRWWENSPKSRIGGYGMLLGELPAGIMAEEMLAPGPGRIRAFFSHGSNLVNAIPDQVKITKALRSLDLLVSIEPFMNETARISDYILPTPLMYERPDITGPYAETIMYYEPFARYTPAIAPPPPGSELAEDCGLFLGLAKRLGIPMKYDGVDLDMGRDYSNEDFLSIVARHAPGGLEALKHYELGHVYDETPQFVEPDDPDNHSKFSLMPPDVEAELEGVRRQPAAPGATVSNGGEFAFRLSSRRLREIFNSCGRNIPELRKRMPYNMAYLNPGDLDRLGLKDGDPVAITSDRDTILARVEGDPTLRGGVVSMAHGWGNLPEDTVFDRDGACTGRLISTDRDLDPINAMPRMSAIPVNVAPAPAGFRNAYLPDHHVSG